VAGAAFSPYNRIDVVKEGHDYVLAVNRDFHQYMHDLSDAEIRDPAWPPEHRRTLARRRLVYDAPFVINPVRGRALVVGAGTGNDVQAALRNGYGSVHSVDIDGRIIDLGRRLHPEHPYADPRAIPVVDDARAFFEQYGGPPFDAVCFGLLDSHAMFSALSSLRLENYVYTEEGLRAAWRHVSPRGHLSVSFSLLGGPWLGDRLYWTIARATGLRPIMLYHGMLEGCTFLVARRDATLDLRALAEFPRIEPAGRGLTVATTTDDWPFLYIRPRTFPWGYLVVLGTVLALAFFSARRVFGRRAVGADFDPLLFLVGAGFLLIETRGVTTLSLLFGSTWMVNAAVFAAVLLVALLANLYVERFGAPPLELCFFLLLLSVAWLWALDHAALDRFSLPVRGSLGGLVNALPVGFAGLIVSALLARSPNPTASLASNLLGSVVGGCLEYLSMRTGLRALALLALAIYLAAFLTYLRRR
jgi:SAM-dependent methyltransferase